jgi:hypothetical protein
MYEWPTGTSTIGRLWVFTQARTAVRLYPWLYQVYTGCRSRSHVLMISLDLYETRTTGRIARKFAVANLLLRPRQG